MCNIMSRPFALLALIAFSAVSLAQHNVTLNDTDPSIQYGGNVSDANLCQVDSNGQIIGGQAGCYYVPSNCTLGAAMGMKENGSASLTFKGSAIYINSLLFDASPLYTITLDGKASDVDGLRPSAPFACYTLFSQTGLDANIDHQIRLSIKDVSPTRNQSSPGANDTYVFSLVNFIYTVPDSSSSHPPIGPIVIGVVGGVLMILAAISAFLYNRRRRRRHNRVKIEINPQPTIPASEVPHIQSLIATQPSFGLNLPARNMDADASSPNAAYALKHQLSPASHPPRTDHIAHLSPMPLNIPTTSLPPPPSDTIRDHPTPNPSTQSPLIPVPGSHITPDEAQLLNTLYSQNVPAAEMAMMIETMRAERRWAGGAVGSSSGGVVHGERDDPPPQYDFKEH